MKKIHTPVFLSFLSFLSLLLSSSSQLSSSLSLHQLIIINHGIHFRFPNCSHTAQHSVALWWVATITTIYPGFLTIKGKFFQNQIPLDG